MPTPFPPGTKDTYTSAESALARVQEIYAAHVEYLTDRFGTLASGQPLAGKASAHYPYVQVTTDTAARVDTRLAYGFVPQPGHYRCTLTRPDLYASYLHEQFGLLLKNHDVPLEVGVSDLPIPIHFAGDLERKLEGALHPEALKDLRDYFDLPDLVAMDDLIVNHTYEVQPGQPSPLALFNAPRIDFSLARLRHYTGTWAEHFQHYVLFTNYPFYIDEFIRHGRSIMAGDEANTADGSGNPYIAFVEPGNIETTREGAGAHEPERDRPAHLPQMPAYHLKRADNSGITMVNIGVGPSNAKNITDHIAVLRPHAWLMLGHCAGLRNSQELGDYVLAHGYVREDHVLDEDLPTWVPLPPLAEVQIALETAVSEITGLTGYALKRVMRTGTVASIDDRNWELREYRDPVRRFRQSRAIALDMESATIAANGFRFRVPYGTLLCVSDRPLHGQLKLPSMATAFYRQQVEQHLKIGLRAMEMLRKINTEQLHSRKLRSFEEVAFR